MSPIMAQNNQKLSLVNFDNFDSYDAVFTVRQQVYALIDEDQWVDALCRVAGGLSKKLQAEVGYCSKLYFQLTFADALWEHLLGDEASLSPWRASLCHLRRNDQQYDAPEECVNPGDIIWLNHERAVARLVTEEDFFRVLGQKVLSPEAHSLDGICTLMEDLKIGPYAENTIASERATEMASDQQKADSSLKRAHDSHMDRSEPASKRQNMDAGQGR